MANGYFKRIRNKKNAFVLAESYITALICFLNRDDFVIDRNYKNTLLFYLEVLYDDIVDELKFDAIKRGKYNTSDNPRSRVFYKKKKDLNKVLNNW